jgi:quinol monooxygenase YgiN
MADIKNDRSLRVVAFFRAKPGRQKELLDILQSLVEPTQSEPGNLSYILHVHEDDPHRFMFDEIWFNRKAFEEHLQKPYIKSLHKKIEHLIEEPARIEAYKKVLA